jgi:hypothetical protein
MITSIFCIDCKNGHVTHNQPFAKQGLAISENPKYIKINFYDEMLTQMEISLRRFTPIQKLIVLPFYMYLTYQV